MKKKNGRRARRRFTEAYGSAERVEWTHRQGCFVPAYFSVPVDALTASVVESALECGGPIEAMHPFGRKDDLTIPCCQKHHGEFHTKGHGTTARRYGLNLAMARDLYDLLWQSYTRKETGSNQ